MYLPSFSQCLSHTNSLHSVSLSQHSGPPNHYLLVKPMPELGEETKRHWEGYYWKDLCSSYHMYPWQQEYKPCRGVQAVRGQSGVLQSKIHVSSWHWRHRFQCYEGVSFISNLAAGKNPIIPSWEKMFKEIINSPKFLSRTAQDASLQEFRSTELVLQSIGIYYRGYSIQKFHYRVSLECTSWVSCIQIEIFRALMFSCHTTLSKRQHLVCTDC